MPIQSTDTTSEIDFSQYGEAWLIKAGVAVVTSGTAIYSNYSADLLDNLGAISSGASAVVLDGTGPQGADQVINEAGGSISGVSNGISSTQNCHIDNRGSISGTDAISLNAEDWSVLNSGSIHALFDGIFGYGDNAVVYNSGTIEADSVGLRYDGGDGANALYRTLTLTNTGLISGTSESLLLEGAASV